MTDQLRQKPLNNPHPLVDINEAFSSEEVLELCQRIISSGVLSLIAFVNYFSNLSLLPFILFLGVSVGGIIMLMSQYNIADIPNFHSTEDKEKYERCQADTYHIGLIVCFIFLFMITLYYVIVVWWNKTGEAFTNFGEAATTRVRGARDSARTSFRSGVASVRSTASSAGASIRAAPSRASNAVRRRLSGSQPDTR